MQHKKYNIKFLILLKLLNIEDRIKIMNNIVNESGIEFFKEQLFKNENPTNLFVFGITSEGFNYWYTRFDEIYEKLKK